MQFETKNIAYKKTTPSKVLLGILTLAIISAAIYFGIDSYSKSLINKESQSVKQETNSGVTSVTDDSDEKDPEQKVETTEYIELEKGYKVTQIDGQYNLLSYPEKVEKDSPLKIVVYSHGSITYVTEDTTDPFMELMIEYGEFFNNQGYIFTASNQHGANWGSKAAVQDIQNSIDFVTAEIGVTNYETYLFGYSMGGLVTLNYATTYPDNLAAVALLAPTSYITEWNATRFELIKEVPVTIWHGTKDVNVPYSLSTQLVAKAQQLSYNNFKLETLETDHWSMDGFYNEQILEFYNSSR